MPRNSQECTAMGPSQANTVGPWAGCLHFCLRENGTEGAGRSSLSNHRSSCPAAAMVSSLCPCPGGSILLSAPWKAPFHPALTGGQLPTTPPTSPSAAQGTGAKVGSGGRFLSALWYSTDQHLSGQSADKQCTKNPYFFTVSMTLLDWFPTYFTHFESWERIGWGVLPGAAGHSFTAKPKRKQGK